MYSSTPPAPAPEFGALIPGPGPCSQQLPACHRSLGVLGDLAPPLPIVVRALAGPAT